MDNPPPPQNRKTTNPQNKNTMRHWIILAALLHTAADTITEHVESQPTGTDPAEKPTGDAPAAPRRGRPPGSTNAPKAAIEPEKPAPTGGKTYEELRALIEPLVKEGRNSEVKAILVKYAPDLKTLATLPNHHKAFEADIDGLSL